MTEKRFTLEMQYWKGNPQGRKLCDNVIGQDGMSVEELCNIASALHCKCEELESVLEVYEDSLNKLEEENKELQERNNRQAKQLDNIYHLIEQRDWRALSDIIDDFKKAEEQLQSEWKCYE